MSDSLNTSWNTSRSPEEIDSELKRAAKTFVFSDLYQGEIIAALPYELAKPYLMAGTDEEIWGPDLDQRFPDREEKQAQLELLCDRWGKAVQEGDALVSLMLMTRFLAWKYLLRHEDWPITPGVNGHMEEVGKFGVKLLLLILQQIESGDWHELTSRGHDRNPQVTEGMSA